MGFFDSLLGGGSETQQTRLPGYVTIPGETISRNVSAIFDRQKNAGSLNPVQNEALGGIEGLARGGNQNLPLANDALSAIFGGQGLNANQTGLADYLTTGGFTNPALAETTRIAMGGDIGSNPYLDQYFNRAANQVGQQFRENVIPGLDTNYAATGRLGSNSYAAARNNAEDTYGRQINDLANQVYGGAYTTDQQRRDQALQSEAGIAQQGVQNRLQGAGLYDTGTGNVFNAIQSLPGLQNLKYDDLSRLFQAGQTTQEAPFQVAGTAADIIGKLRGNQTSSTQSNPNQLAQLLGLGTSIAGTASLFFP